MSATLNPATEPGFGPLPLILRIFCAVPFLTGLADIFGGAAFLQAAGAGLPRPALANAMLNNEIKFWGVIWFGYGVTLWWVSARLRTQSTMFRILMGTLFCSGLGRALSYALYGSPGFVLTGAMVLELAGGAGLWAWYRSLIRKAQ